MTRISVAGLLTIVIAACFAPMSVFAQQTFTYQGELSDNGMPANGMFDLRFELWNGPNNSANQLGFNEFTNFEVVNGRFTVDLNFPAGFTSGGSRWLAVEVDGFTLSPFTLIKQAPFSIRAQHAEETRGLVVGGTDEEIGLGTNNPTAKLDVVSNTTDNGNNTARFSAPNIGSNTSHIHFGTFGDWFIRSADDDGKVVMQDTGGSVGIGTASAGDLARLTVSGGNFDSAVLALSLDATQPTINAINIDSGAALWAQGSSDAEPEGGGIIVVGAEAGPNISIDRNEIMARNNGQTSTLFLNADGGNISMGPQQTHPAFAYGKVSSAGTIISASNNVTSVQRIDDGRYAINVTGGAQTNDVFLVTSASGIVNAAVVSTHFELLIETAFGTDIDSQFSFVIYRP